MKNRVDKKTESKFYIYCIEQLNFTKSTARYKNNLVTNYLNWLTENNITIKKMIFIKLLDYIGYLQEKGTSKYTINYNLRAISQYNEFLKINNVAKDVILKGTQTTQVLYLTEEELQSIYENFEPYNTKGHYIYSDKIMLGLMIYQALDERDIFRLELQHINFNTGTMYIPSGSLMKEARVLPLQAHQILPLKHYIDNYRKPFHKEHLKSLPLGEVGGAKLFYPNCEKLDRLHDQIKLLSKGLKQTAIKTDIKATRLYLLRQSRIAIWLKQHGIRKAQYMAGYRAINSIENFKINDISDLQDQIKLYHPLNKK
jgi:integrase/recombinase XerD